MIDKKTFICERCGECCKTFLVKVMDEEIKKLEKLGHKDFFQKDFDGNESLYVLKKDENGCIFFNKKTSLCNIYAYRPETCRNYPFLDADEVKSCKPGKNTPIIR